MSYSFDTELTIKGTTQYTNYDFNSYCRFNGKYLGSHSSDGICELTGDDDNGVAINAYFEPLSSDYGYHGFHRCRYLYLGGESDGDLYVEMKFDEQTGEKHLVNNRKLAGQQTARVTINRSQYGRYSTVQVGNVNGADFSVDSLKGLFTPRALGNKAY